MADSHTARVGVNFYANLKGVEPASVTFITVQQKLAR